MTEEKRGRDLTDLEKKLVEKGIRCGALLANPVFTETLSELHAILKDAIVDTSPHEEKKRQMLYYMNAGLTDLENLLMNATLLRTEAEAAVIADETEEQDNFS